MGMETVWTLLGMLLTTVGVLAAAYGVTRWIASRGTASGWGGFPMAKGGVLRVLRQIPVGREQRLLLVRLERRVLLLGCSSGEMTVLAELTEDEAAAWLTEPESPAPPSFLQVLQENLRKKK